jgi:hypothetical protein
MSYILGAALAGSPRGIAGHSTRMQVHFAPAHAPYENIPMPTAYEFIKLGMNVQQLRSLSSVSIFLGTSLVEFTHLEENQPDKRCSVRKTVELLRAVLAQLDDFGFTRTLAAMQPLEPMRKEMEEALSRVPQQESLTLRDHFADKIVEHMKNVMIVLKEEASARQTS